MASAPALDTQRPRPVALDNQARSLTKEERQSKLPAKSQTARALESFLQRNQADLQKWNAKIGNNYAVSDARVAQIKKELLSILKFPEGSQIKLNSNKQGDAINPAGPGAHPAARIIDGSLKVGDSTYRFSVDLASGQLKIDGRPSKLDDVQKTIMKLNEEYKEALKSREGIKESLQRNDRSEFFSGKNEEFEIIVTENGRSHEFKDYATHLQAYVRKAGEKDFSPVKIQWAERLRDGGTTNLSGTLADGTKINLHVPVEGRAVLNKKVLKEK